MSPTIAAAPDAIMRRIYHHCSPRSLVALRQVNKAWHAAATRGVLYNAAVRGNANVEPVDRLCTETIERAFRRQYRFETVFAAREVTLQKPVTVGHRFSFTADKDVLVGIESGSSLVRWDLTDQDLTTLHSGANHYCWGSDRSQLYYAEEFGSAFVLDDLGTYEERITDLGFSFADITLALDVDAEHRVVAAGSWAGTCAARDLDSDGGTVPLASMGEDATGFKIHVVDQGRAVVHTGPRHDLHVTTLLAPGHGRLLPDILQTARLRPARAPGVSDLGVAEGGLWRIENWAEPITLEALLPPALQLIDMRWLSDGHRLVTVGRDRTCRLYDLHHGRPHLVWKKKSFNALVGLHTAERGDLFAYRDAAGTLHLREALASGCISLGKLRGLAFDHPMSVDFSEDGEHVMVDKDYESVVIKRLVPAYVPQALGAGSSLAYRMQARYDR